MKLEELVSSIDQQFAALPEDGKAALAGLVQGAIGLLGGGGPIPSQLAGDIMTAITRLTGKVQLGSAAGGLDQGEALTMLMDRAPTVTAYLAGAAIAARE